MQRIICAVEQGADKFRVARDSLASRTHLFTIPAIAGLRRAHDLLTYLPFSIRFGAHRSVQGVALKGNDLNERIILFQRVAAVRRYGKEGEVDVGMIEVCIHDPRDDLDDIVRAVEQWREQTRPALFRSDGPVIVKLRGWARLTWVPRHLFPGVEADHRAVKVPARIQTLAVIADLEPHGGGQGENPAQSERVENRHAPLYGQTVIVRSDGLARYSRQFSPPFRQEFLCQARLGDDAEILRRAQELNDVLTQHRPSAVASYYQPFLRRRSSSSSRSRRRSPRQSSSSDELDEEFELELLELFDDELELEFEDRLEFELEPQSSSEFEFELEFELEFDEELELEFDERFELPLLDEFDEELPANC